MINKIIILLSLAAFLFVGISFSQSLWTIQIPPMAWGKVQGDTSVAHLRSVMLNACYYATNLDSVMSGGWYDAAVLLAYYHGATEKEFILDHMQPVVYAYPAGFLGEAFFFQYQYVRGFLGDSGAIGGMDTVVQLPRFSAHHRSWALQLLAQVGRYDHYDSLLSLYSRGGVERKWALPALGLYGRDSRYANTIRTTLEQLIRDSSDYVSYKSAADAMATFDQPYAASVLDQLFRSTTAETRKWYWIALQSIDPDGQPERVCWVVPLEGDEITRNEYLPIPGCANSGYCSKRYYEPFFIKFLVDRDSVEPSGIGRYDIRQFLDAFKPLHWPDSVALVTELDSLLKTKQQVVSYGWVSDRNFISSLDSNLTSGAVYLVARDSNNCARQIKLFQQKVDDAYHDTLHTDPKRTITKEAWKYLHYNAQYILDRLPVPTKQ